MKVKPIKNQSIMLSNNELIKAFVENPELTAKNGSLTAKNGKLFSYYTIIAQHTPKGIIVNNTKYSVTTSRHQSLLRYYANGNVAEKKEGIDMGTQRLA